MISAKKTIVPKCQSSRHRHTRHRRHSNREGASLPMDSAPGTSPARLRRCARCLLAGTFLGADRQTDRRHGNKQTDTQGTEATQQRGERTCRHEPGHVPAAVLGGVPGGRARGLPASRDLPGACRLLPPANQTDTKTGKAHRFPSCPGTPLAHLWQSARYVPPALPLSQPDRRQADRQSHKAQRAHTPHATCQLPAGCTPRGRARGAHPGTCPCFPRTRQWHDGLFPPTRQENTQTPEEQTPHG